MMGLLVPSICVRFMGLSDLPNNIQKSIDAIPLNVRPSQTKRNLSGTAYFSNLCICT
jgi:hypothetical protein